MHIYIMMVATVTNGNSGDLRPSKKRWALESFKKCFASMKHICGASDELLVLMQFRNDSPEPAAEKARPS